MAILEARRGGGKEGKSLLWLKCVCSWDMREWQSVGYQDGETDSKVLWQSSLCHKDFISVTLLSYITQRFSESKRRVLPTESLFLCIWSNLSHQLWYLVVDFGGFAAFIFVSLQEPLFVKKQEKEAGLAYTWTPEAVWKKTRLPAWPS